MAAIEHGNGQEVQHGQIGAQERQEQQELDRTLVGLSQGHAENAQRAGIDLLGAVSHNQGWQAGLRKETTGIEDIVRLLNLVNTYLSDEAVFVEKHSVLTEDCQTAYRKLCELAGHIDAHAEEL